MVKDHSMVMHDLRGYASPKSRLTRMIASGDVIRVRRGLYLDGDDRSYSVKSLAGIIYGPSYISFEYALSQYGMIPERVNAVTSAVYHKNKNREFHTPIGDFYYHYMPAGVFPHGVLQKEENGQSYLIASPEKALCDMLYKTRGISSRSAVDALLFDDWRIERKTIALMDKETFRVLAPLYKRTVFTHFLDWIDHEAAHA